MKTKLTLTLLCALAIPGCYMDLGAGGDSLDEPVTPWEPTPYGNDLDVARPQIDGRLGAFAASGAGYVAYAYSDSNGSNIDIRVRGEGAVIMNALNIDGNIDSLEVGRTYNQNARDFDAPAGLYFSMVGCSGPDDNLWEYDRSTDDIVVSVEEGPEEGTIELFYTANFDGESSSTGSFIITN